MNDSQLRNTSYIKEKSSITLLDLYENSNLLSCFKTACIQENDSHYRKPFIRILHWILTVISVFLLLADIQKQDQRQNGRDQTVEAGCGIVQKK